MKLVLLGTGCPQCDPARRGPANLVLVRGRQFLVDCGSGVTQRLIEAGSRSADIDALFLTHLHTDHVIDFYQFVMTAWHQGRTRPQRIFGPPGTRSFVEGTLALWATERAQRIAHEQRPSLAAFDMEIVEIAPGVVWDEDDVRISAVAVAHQPVKHAFGFVFESGGIKAVLSGDTAYCPDLIAAARGADVLVHECFVHGEMPVVPGVRSAQTVAAVASYHTPADQVGRVATEAGVKLLILNHFVPTRFDRTKLLNEVTQDFTGPLVVGEDLLTYDCGTRQLGYGDLALRLGPMP